MNIQIYKSFLASKNDYWRKAKQKEYKDLDRLLLELQNFEHFTARNAMTLRILGLVRNIGGERVELTPVGEQILHSASKQSIIDEQLLKIYLDGGINTGLHIPVFPMQILCNIFAKLEYLTFEEYMLFVCWVNNISQVSLVIGMLKQYRQAGGNEKEEVNRLFQTKVAERGTKDIIDNVSRLFNVFGLSSFIAMEGSSAERTLHRNSSASIYVELSNKIDMSILADYLNYDYNYQHLLDIQAEYRDITTPLADLTNDERAVIKSIITDKKGLPALENVSPILIEPTIVKTPQATKRKIKPQIEKEHQAYKPDYAALEDTRRMVGLFAEKIVVKSEYNYLAASGRIDLARRMRHVSLEDDSIGYDIVSFALDNDGKESEQHIEVKAIRGYPKTFSFYISQRELELAQVDKVYQLCLVFDYHSKNPKIWKITNVFLTKHAEVEIKPTQFMVTITRE